MNAFRHFVAPVAALCLGVGAIGCSSEPKAEQVPANARMEMQGDRQLAYTAQRAGEIFVYDVDDNTLVYSGKVEKGQVVTVDPEEDKVMIDNRLAVEKDIHAGNRHRIYFVPDRNAPDRVIEEKTTIREERPAAERTERRIETERRIDGDTTSRREENRAGEADTTIRRERTVETESDGDVTVKKETTIKSE